MTYSERERKFTFAKKLLSFFKTHFYSPCAIGTSTILRYCSISELAPLFDDEDEDFRSKKRIDPVAKRLGKLVYGTNVGAYDESTIFCQLLSKCVTMAPLVVLAVSVAT